MTPLDEFVRRRQRAAEILDGLADEVTLASRRDPLHERALRAVAERAREGRFVVLLLGCFSSGKSTLLNALLGRPVMPVKVNPCTAILTEVVYGEEPGVEVRRGGATEQMPLAAFTEAYQLRTESDREAGAELKDRFGDVDRAVVRYPLPLLGNGVVLLDTPGLDDDAVRTARTLSSLPDADAVIVVLSATRFLTDLERRTLTRNLLPLGLTNLFFPVTMIDLLDAISDQPERDLQDLQRRGREVLGPLCQVQGEDRFAERFFPLDARGALNARWDRPAGRPRDVDANALAATGVPAFERALEAFLVEERGRAQMRHLHETARRVREDLRREADVERATADASIEELERRRVDLLPRFSELEGIARRVGRTVDQFIDRQKQLVWQDLRAFMARTEAELPEAAAKFDLRGLASLDLLSAAGRARVEAQLHKELDRWLAERVGEWQRSLEPRMDAALGELRLDLAADAADFDAVSARIVTDFAGGTFKVRADGADAREVDPVERWFSVAMGAVLLSPGAMAAGWSEGYEGALKGAASRLGVRIALLTLGALLGPIGWVGLLLYVVSDAVLLVLTGGQQLRRIREQLAERVAGKLVAQADAAKDEIQARVAEGLAPLREGLVGAALAEAEELRALLDRTIAAREEAKRAAKQKVSSWERTLAAFDAGIDELGQLAG